MDFGGVFGFSWWLLLAGLGVLIVLAVVLGLLVGAVGERTRPRDELAAQRDRSQRWASRKEVVDLRGGIDDPCRLYLGMVGDYMLFAPPFRSKLIIAPTGSGKTPRQAVIDGIRHTGPAVMATVKTDLYWLTKKERLAHGPVWVFDPAGDVGEGTVRWSPLDHVHSWADAVDVGQAVVKGSSGDTAKNSTDEFWDTLGRNILAPLLWAAKLSNKSFVEMVGWVQENDLTRPESILEEAGATDAVLRWRTHVNADPRTRANTYTTVNKLLEGWIHPSMAPVLDTRTAGVDVLDVDALVHGRDGQFPTLYLVGSANRQEMQAPVFATLLGLIYEELTTSYQRTAMPLEPPLLMLLDEAANIAPVRDLDRWASSGAGQGLLLVSIWQDEGQLVKRYGDAGARTIKNNHHAVIYLSGISDEQTRDNLSRRIGQTLLQQVSTSRSRDSVSRTTSSSEMAVAPTETLAEWPADEAIVVMDRRKPIRVRVPGYWELAVWRDRIDTAVLGSFAKLYSDRRRYKPARHRVRRRAAA